MIFAETHAQPTKSLALDRADQALANALRAELNPGDALGRFLADHLIDAATHLQALLAKRRAVISTGTAPDKELARSITSAERSFSTAYSEYLRHDRLRDTRPRSTSPIAPSAAPPQAPPSAPEAPPIPAEITLSGTAPHPAVPTLSEPPTPCIQPRPHANPGTLPAPPPKHQNRRQRRALLALQRHVSRASAALNPPRETMHA
jgi:hypothetical protein